MVPIDRGRWTSTRELSVAPHCATTGYLPARSDEGTGRLIWKVPSGPAVVVPVTDPGRATVAGAAGAQPVPETRSVWPALRTGWSRTRPGATPPAAADGEGPGERLGAGVAATGGVWVPEGPVAVGSTVRATLREGVCVGWGVRDGAVGAGDVGAVLGTVSTGTGAAVTTTVQLLVAMGGSLRMSGDR